jgi:signal transduction histidine kinase/type II secretory pathway pseudopilin PulG
MKRSWISIIVVAGVLGLLAVLAVLQYNWQLQVSDADREKMQKRVGSDAEHFADDFNREIQAAYINFQIGAEAWRKGDYNEFNERYDFWRSKTAYPELIKDLYFFENKRGAAPLHYNTQTRTFEPAELTAELDDIRTQFSDEKNFKPLNADRYTMVLPIHDMRKKVDEQIFIRRPRQGGIPPPIVGMPDRYGDLAILLDQTVIRVRILPDLVKKYFADGDFRVAITDRSDQLVYGDENAMTTADASVPIFDLSPDKMMFFASRSVPGKIAEAKERRDVIVSQHVESHTFSRTITGDVDKAGTFKVELQKGDGVAGNSIFTSNSKDNDDAWKLGVQHRDGSIGVYIDGVFRRNVAIGTGLFSLLALAILGIFLSAQRAKMLAQRQVDFVSSVSHEFRTPLAVIYSAGENLADGIAKEETQVERYGNLIKGEGRKLSSMVEQILEFAGANSGRRKFNFAETDVSDVIEDALAESRPLFDAAGCMVEAEIANDLPTVSADFTALSGAVQNLIANSVKYGNGSKWLRISAENGGGTVKITVEDHGIGIAKSELGKIFEPFYRAKDVVDAQIHGNGLGLSLVKQIVEAHSGKVTAESEVGKGSKFTIELPQKEI